MHPMAKFLVQTQIEKIETTSISVNASSVWLVQGFLARIGKVGIQNICWGQLCQ